MMKNRLWVVGLMLMLWDLKAQNCLRGNCQNGFGTLIFPNKSRYTGEFVDGWMTGRGLYYYANGNKYIGYWHKNQKNGDGKLVYANGDIYSGKFQLDRISGFGSMVYKNGEKYVGEWKNEKPSGKGSFYYASGERYEGEFVDGKFEGKGKFLYNDGSSYEGEWKNDQRNGYGEFFDGKSKTIAGQWQNDQPLKVIESDFNDVDSSMFADTEVEQTSGVAASRPIQKTEPVPSNAPANNHTAVQNKIEPIADKKQETIAPSDKEKILENKQNPVISDSDEPDNIPASTENKVQTNQTSVLKPTDNPVIHMEQSNPASTAMDKPSNPNIKPQIQTNNPEEKLPNCNTEFCKSGKGSLDYADGSKYVGEFLNGEPRGKGICYYANGDRYEGMWDNHAPNGEGVMYFKSGLIYGAIWDHGTAKKQLSSKQEFVFNPDIKEVKDPAVKIWAVVVGVSRYEHMPSLKYSDDDAYKIYAFLKSPEGGALPDGQIRLLIDEDASRNNILKALNELCLKADENDVVMMYFSGHGLEGTFIPIDYDGYQNALKHDELRELFNKSHAKHKVCYADACHSGSLLAAKSPFSSELNFFYEELDKSSGGTAFMMSSKSKEYSLEDGGLRQGIFSHYLIRGLKGEADFDHNKTITIRELFDWVSKNVKEYSGSAQSPVIAGDYDENMPVGFVREKY